MNMQGSTSVGAGATNDNILAGQQWEFLPFNALLEFGLVGDANGRDLRVSVYSGNDTLLEESPVSFANRMPVYPDDFTLKDFVAAGARMKVRVRNTNAGAVVLNWTIRVTPA